MSTNWHSKEVVDILSDLGTSESGLSVLDAKESLLRMGPNSLPEQKVDSYLTIFLRQFQSSLIYILLGASVLIFFIEGASDALIILFVLLINAIVGSIQEGKAQNTLKALKKLAKTTSVVLRGGVEMIIEDKQVVPGDIIKLSEGVKVPADARVISSNNLKVDESSLTGESLPVLKVSDKLSNKKLVIGDQKNMVFKGTNVLVGSAIAVVVATGMKTELGKIAKTLEGSDTDMPLKKNIKALSRLIIIIVATLSVFLFSLGIYKDIPYTEMFGVVVSLSVSIIPSGLPIVITLILATGVYRMSRRHVLVKKMQAVEALGQAKVIAVDKTGTITKNELMVEEVYVNQEIFRISGNGYEMKGDISSSLNIIDPVNHPPLILAAKIGALSAEGHASFDGKEKKWRVTGDPTEAAISTFAGKAKISKEILNKEMPLVKTFPFDYKLKFRASLHREKRGYFLAVIGAPEEILSRVKYVELDGKKKKITKDYLKEAHLKFEEMSSRALRVIAVAYSKGKKEIHSSEEVSDLVFVGFYGLKDGLRDEVKSSVLNAREAGIKIVMITGDHRITAEAVAKEAGIFKDGDKVLTGVHIDEMSDDELAKVIESVSIYARVTPEHKMRIINAYRSLNITIAMTGDGVNDAPSLVAADLGVSMGKIGTEVAKEAGDIILLDDNFGNIVSAVEEGRSIYKNIKKVILYLFSTSLGEVLTIVVALIIDLPLPILAAQIIWLNFVTDGFLVAALAMEPKSQNAKADLFQKPEKYLVDGSMATRMLLMGTTMMIGTLVLFSSYLDDGLPKAWTISLTVLCVYQWFNAWNSRSEKESILKTKFLENKYLVLAQGVVIFLQVLAVYNPFLQKILKTTPLEVIDWFLVIIVALSIVLVDEIRKFFARETITFNKEMLVKES